MGNKSCSNLRSQERIFLLPQPCRWGKELPLPPAVKLEPSTTFPSEISKSTSSCA